MTPRQPKDIAASVRQRLLNKAHTDHRPFNELLQYYAMERFLFRLGASEHATKFVLKGALLFMAWRAPASRPTADIDLLGRTSNAVDAIVAMMAHVYTIEVEPDGLTFDTDRIVAERIAEGADYQGIRVKIRGNLGTARVMLQLDIGFGDVIVPRVQQVSYPTLLDMSPPRIRCYSRETTIAEKFEAMTKLGILNSRMKDFYDIWFLSRRYEFDGWVLAMAIVKTFAHRDTPIEPATVAFSQAFAQDAIKQTQWKAFVRKAALKDAPTDLAEVVARIRDFLQPVAKAAAAGESFDKRWRSPGPWS
jgi:hypothetical protein